MVPFSLTRSTSCRKGRILLHGRPPSRGETRSATPARARAKILEEEWGEEEEAVVVVVGAGRRADFPTSLWNGVTRRVGILGILGILGSLAILAIICLIVTNKIAAVVLLPPFLVGNRSTHGHRCYREGMREGRRRMSECRMPNGGGPYRLMPGEEVCSSRWLNWTSDGLFVTRGTEVANVTVMTVTTRGNLNLVG